MNQPELKNILQLVWAEVAEFCASIHPDVAHFPVAPGKWTISQELDHLLLSSEPIVRMLHAGHEKISQLPIIEKSHLVYDRVKEWYYQVLTSQNVSAPSKFRTDDEPPADWSAQQERWKEIGNGIGSGFDKWTEDQLDSAQVQHPVLKNLWVREMLFFTHIHTQHHLDSMVGKGRIVSAL